MVKMTLPLEKQVVSLDSAKRLKEFGCPQESLWWWTVLKGKQGEIIRDRDFRHTIKTKLKIPLEQYIEISKKEIQCYSAYTVAELFYLYQTKFGKQPHIPNGLRAEKIADYLANHYEHNLMEVKK